MENKYDVIIIGAGPAGLECARQLKDSSLSVLIIEKNAVIGPKKCAGGITYLVDEFDIPYDIVNVFTKQMLIIDKKRMDLNLVKPLKTISRIDLSDFQQGQIKDALNTTVFTNTAVIKIYYNRIILENGSILEYKILVGADGFNSIARKYLNLHFEYYYGSYYELPDVDKQFKWYTNPKTLKSGYIWVFPHQTNTNIGVYFNPKKLKSITAKNILDNFLYNNNYCFDGLKIQGGPLNTKYDGFQFGNIYLIGEAAGLVLKKTGEGISFAMISGREIGKKILNPNYGTPELFKII